MFSTQYMLTDVVVIQHEEWLQHCIGNLISLFVHQEICTDSLWQRFVLFTQILLLLLLYSWSSSTHAQPLAIQQDEVLVLVSTLCIGSICFTFREKYKEPAGDPLILFSFDLMITKALFQTKYIIMESPSAQVLCGT